MNYGLKRYAGGSSAFIDISGEEYRNIKLAKENLLEMVFIEEKFDVVIENYLELEIEIMEISARYMVLRNLSYTRYYNEKNLINRRLINLLSACRSYLDHTKHHLHNIFGKDSEIVKEIEEFKNQQYDQCFGYRVMEALRNYVQHRGFPISSLTNIMRSIESESGNRILFSLTPHIYPGDLEEDKDFKKPVLEELKSSGDKIDIKPLIRDYIASLGSVHEKIRAVLKDDIYCWTQTILTAMDQFKKRYPKESSLIGLAAVVRNDDGTYSQPVDLFKEFMDYRQQLEKKNSSLTTLGKRYVSSEVIEPDS